MRRFTITRLYNLMVAEIQYRLRSPRLYHYPTVITIEPGNICNLRCPLCPTGQRDASARHGLINFEDFRDVVDEIGEYLTLIRLYNWGEPTLNKNLGRMVEYATGKGIDVKISTNLSMPLSDREIEDLAAMPFQKVYISANGASSETYLKYHIGGDFDLVMKNMRSLIARKTAISRNRTELVWLFHVFRHNEHEIEKARLMAKEMGIKLSVNKMRTDMGREVFEMPGDAIKRDGKWVPTNPEYNIFDMENVAARKHFRCNLLWKESVINWDGSVMPCCFIYSEQHSFGNIRESSFKEIWNNDMYVAARKAIRSAMNAAPTSRKTVCHTCKSKGFPFNQ